MIPDICAGHLAAHAGCAHATASSENESFCQLPNAALCAVLGVNHAHGMDALPAGMRSLKIITLYGGLLGTKPGWLPTCSAAGVRTLNASRTGLQRLPEYMPALEVINVSRCGYLAQNWLPGSSAKSVRIVLAQSSALQCIPGDMHALDKVDVSKCKHLLRHWLPESSGVQVSSMRANSSGMQRLPEGMAALETVSVLGCENLEPDWLPESVRRCRPRLVIVA